MAVALFLFSLVGLVLLHGTLTPVLRAIPGSNDEFAFLFPPTGVHHVC